MALQSFGQSSKGFIIKKGGEYNEGFISFDHRQPWQIQFNRFRQGSSMLYSSEQLAGFKLKDGKNFVTKTILADGKPLHIFIEVLGDSTFFYFRRDNVFLKPSSASEQIREQDLLPYLRSLTAPSDSWYDELHLFKLKPKALRYFVNNRAEGKSPTIMFSSVGVFSSFNRSVLTSKGSWLEGNDSPVKATSLNISAGAFADLPLWSVNNLSVQTQASYGKMRFNETTTGRDTRYDYKVDLDYASLSLLPKYSHTLSKLRLFAQAGPSVTYILQSDTQAVKAVTEGDKVWLHLAPSLVSSEVMFGFEAGAGISYFYLPRHYVSVGISQGNTFSKQFHISNQSLTVSLNL
ncbi:hypothetical protein A3841_04510 [Pontibacter flavimaris]|uniref:Outer membrane protein beta-barrel domain-containing protein n=1 Tax=Pontibacter flavimaris TaxID=1797110 RepID=A0A1Q5PAE2_9BACT|nr:hypothetical protein A3841_04510 [Pontibacter flavimaris]